MIFTEGLELRRSVAKVKGWVCVQKLNESQQSPDNTLNCKRQRNGSLSLLLKQGYVPHS